MDFFADLVHLHGSTCVLSIFAGAGVLLLVAVAWWWNTQLKFWYYYYSPVSYPGDPIRRKLTKLGTWEDKDHFLNPGWEFIGAAESHEHTLKKWGGQRELLGEPAGRHLWAKAGGGPRTRSQAVKPSMPAYNPHKNPNAGDKVFRALQISRWAGPRPDEASQPKTAMDAARKGVSFYQMLQCEDGHWGGDYGGPVFLMPGLIIVHYVTGAPLEEHKREGMLAMILSHQQADGGWGTHIEDASTMFGTVLNYISLRLLGVSKDDPPVAKARQFIRENGGAVMCPSWAKFWLTLLGVHEWGGINSIPAELWMLPRWFPFHPGRLWCHCRMVYLPMCYLYCMRFQHDADRKDALCAALREELYTTPYDQIDWDSTRHFCSDKDNYSGVHWVMRTLQNVLAVYERWGCRGPLRWLRRKGTQFAIDYIHEEDTQTNFIDIGPVNKTLNMLSVWVDRGRNTDHDDFQRHLQREDDYLWVAEDGMKMQGYNGSQCWDTSFALQGIIEAGLDVEFPDMCKKAWSYFERTQIPCDEEKRDLFFRHVSKGGWPFSTAAHGWPISDCTSEGLKAVLALSKLSCMREEGLHRQIGPDRLRDAVNVILTLQNHDGGWATYENNRGFGWFELLNPSEVFGDIMIDYSYVECTAACVTALIAFAHEDGTHRRREIQRSISRGRRFMRSIQRDDGSWYGSWGCCFTYGTWFGIEGLLAAGEPSDSPAISRAVKFLLGKQNGNGGWGESYLACVNKEYPAAGTHCTKGPDLGEGQSGVVQTSWAVLGLLAAEVADRDPAVREAVERGVRYLMSKQRPSGDWDQEACTGVFNRSCGITYTAYRNIFPIWALGRYGRLLEKKSE